MDNEFITILCTCPDNQTAEELSLKLVTAQHAACINIIPNIKSIFTWEGKIETSQEHLLIIKTTTASYNTIETFITNHHPYDCPEILALPIKQGAKNYLQWIAKSVN